MRDIRIAMLGLMLAAGNAAGAETMPAHERLRLASRVLGETRRINVYLPPDYDVHAGMRYPVLYMPDGGENEDFPHVADAADRLIRAGVVRPFLIVGVENTVRRRDMTGPTRDPEDLKVTSQPGGAPAFRRFFATELLPVMQARYRTTEETVVMGESLAGLFVVDTLVLQPDLFDTYIAIDPSLWWNRRAVVRDATQRLAGWGDRRVRLLLTAGGTESNGADVEAFAVALKAAAPSGLSWTYLPRPDVRHDNIYRAMDDQLLQAVFGPGGPTD